MGYLQGTAAYLASTFVRAGRLTPQSAQGCYLGMIISSVTARLHSQSVPI